MKWDEVIQFLLIVIYVWVWKNQINQYHNRTLKQYI